MSEPKPHPKDPLPGVTLELMLNALVDYYGWAEMGRQVRVRCFHYEPSVKSSLAFLRKIPWIGPKLFGWKSRQKVQKEIIVCVTVGIADPADLPRDVGLPKNAIIGKEYVSGVRLEPGDRKGTSSDILARDLDALDERSLLKDIPERKDAARKGTGTITPGGGKTDAEPTPVPVSSESLSD